MNKRIVGIVGVVFVLLISFLVLFHLLSNGKKQDTGSESESASEWKDSYCSVFQVNYMEDGMIYIAGDNRGSQIRYCDNSSFYDGVICTDKTCKHSTASDSSCSARVSSASGGVARRGDSLYFFMQDDEEGVYDLYRSDLTGKNRVSLCEIKNLDMLMDVFYHKNMIYYSYCELDINDNDHRVLHVCGFDIETQEEQQLYELDSTQAIIQGMNLQDNILYVSVIYNDATNEELLEHKDEEEFEQKHQHCEIIGINCETGEEVLAVEGTASNRTFFVIQGKLICHKGNGICCYELDTLQESIVSDQDYSAIYSDSDSYAYYLDCETRDGKDVYVYFQYDPKENKWTTLGESSTYYYALVGDHAYGDVESEDGTSTDRVHLSKNDFLSGNFDNESRYERIN